MSRPANRPATRGPEGGKQEGRRRIIPVAALLLCAAVFASLGTWQVKRLFWKEALIAHVEAVIHAPPADGAALPASPPEQAMADLEYRRLQLAGRYETGATTLVTALTDEGAGYWAMTPLRLANGRAVWVNRGFVPTGTRRDAVAAPTGPVTVVGLVRRAEPGSTWLRANHPEARRWYYRDLAGLSAANAVRDAGPAWFLDAQSETPATPKAPMAGLTVVQFPNNHLSYAITWFLLCGLSLFGIALVLRNRA
ncbi:MAG TPA: SURF1 family protein [Novosphingobium sp.]|nr:SURF1 family protein [Novosphingobium sp.]